MCVCVRGGGEQIEICFVLALPPRVMFLMTTVLPTMEEDDGGVVDI